MVVLGGMPDLQEKELRQRVDELRDKLSRAQRQVAGLREKSRILEMQYEDARNRDRNSNELVMELLERQRELNVMLNRANIMLSRTQEAIALTSVEFNEMAKALPEPKKAEWSDRVAKINELFRKTGIEDAELSGAETPRQPSFADPLGSGEIRKESEEAFGRNQGIWQRTERREPPRVEAEPVDEPAAPTPIPEAPEPEDIDSVQESDELHGNGERPSQVQPKSWWQKILG